MNTGNIIEFQSDKFGSMRVSVANLDPLFIAVDVARLLGYSNTSKAILDHCKHISKVDIYCKSGSYTNNIGEIIEINKITPFNAIPESDVYRLIMRSNMKCAESFQDWVVETVIPEARRDGKFSIVNAIDRVSIEYMDKLINDTYTYLISDQSGLIKIGRSTNVEERIKQLSTGNPTISLLFIIDGDVERILHKKYAGKRVAGEWFNLSEYDIKEIKQLYN